MNRIDAFLRVAADQRASDLHFHGGKPPMVRYQGELIPLPFRRLGRGEAQRMLREILTSEQREALDERRELDFSYALQGVGRFRVSVFEQSGGMSAVFRIIPNEVATLAELRLPPVLRQLCRLPRGLVCVTGPTGSGKTTTLAAMLREINGSSKRHIVTIEDPIEYLHSPVRSLVSQREIGEHASSFASALRSALREAPDVLVVGELRDYETIQLALGAAEAGVLVFATLHANSAAKAIDRLVGACPQDVQEQVRGVLSVLLEGVVAQRLCRLVAGSGRVAAVEVLLRTYAVAHLIRENKIHLIDAHLRSGEQSPLGARSLDAALAQLVAQRLVEPSEARRHAHDPEAFAETVTA